MRICMLTSGHVVYDNRIYYKEILSLKKVYDEVFLIAPGEKDFITADGVTVKAFKGRKSWYDRFNPMREMFLLAKELRADVYHAHEPDSLQVAVKLKHKTGAAVVYDSHEYYPEAFAEHFNLFKGIIKDFIYIYERNLARQADYIVTVNDLLVDKFKNYNDKVELIPNYPVFRNEDIVKKYNDKPVFIYAGGLREDRGILKILEAVSMVECDASFIFIGEFEVDRFKNEVMEYVENSLKGRDITFTGKIPHLDVFKYLGMADAGFVLLQPNNWRYVNSEPVKLFEYMMSKTAVIASDFPMMRSIVESSGCGFVVKPNDPREIAEIIKIVCRDRERIREMGERGAKRAAENYNWAETEKKLLGVYEFLEQRKNKRV